MKTLQNNYTTLDQSKRLLELGLPADSADMHYHQECVRIKYDGKEEFEYFLRCGKPDTNNYSTDIPCWSVGRLIEIYVKAKGLDYMSIDITPNSNLIEELMYKYKMSLGIMDFSKLKD